MTSKTSSTSLETDCLRKYQANPELWDDVWDKVEGTANKNQFQEQCWTTSRNRVLHTKRGQKIQIEENKDGYCKINLTFDRLDGSGKPARREYTHNETGKIGTRKDTRKESMYLHHLAYLKRTYNTPECFRRSRRRSEARHTLSHLCNRRGCFRPQHVSFEAHLYNLSRGACNAELCVMVGHDPPCITHTSSVLAAVAKLNREFGYGPDALNEAAVTQNRLSQPLRDSTNTSSSTHSAGDSKAVDADDVF